MPIPKRRSGERRTKFVKRCMGNKIMKKEFKQKQRLAICLKESKKE